jgi:hypothetical protein
VYDDGTVINNITGTEYNATDSSGYKKVSYSYKKKIWQIQSHRLVWVAFNGPIEDDSLVINHINGIKSDNRLVNLELVSVGDNARHAVRTGLSRVLRSEEKPNAVFTNDDVKYLRKAFANNVLSIQEIQIKYKCSFNTVKSMLVGYTYYSINTKYCPACKQILLSMSEISRRTVNAISSSLILKIQELHIQGLSSVGIAKALGINRNTVMKYW